ncbi:MAG: hypothetical protein ACKO7P_02730, partial [Bacteroidota bacterium]
MKKIILFVAAFFMLISCSKDDNSSIVIEGGQAFRMEINTLTIENQTLGNDTYDGYVGNILVKLLKSNDNQLLIMFDKSIPLGNQQLIIPSLNNLKVNYLIQDYQLTDTSDNILAPLLTNMNDFQQTSFANSDTNQAIQNFNFILSSANADQKNDMALLYQLNRSVIDGIINNDYSNVSGRTEDGTLFLLQKHKAAALFMAGGLYVLLYAPTPIEKAIGATALIIGARKTFEFGVQFQEKCINTMNLQVNNILAVDDNQNSSIINLYDSSLLSMPIRTVDRTVTEEDEPKTNLGTKLYFTYKKIYNGFVEKANPLISFINTNLFSSFSLIPTQITPTSSQTVNNTITAETFQDVNITTQDPNITIESATLGQNSELNLKVKVVNSSVTLPYNTYIYYTFSDE